MAENRLKFTGEGFSKEPLSEEEMQKLRERAHHYDRNFLSAEDFLRETNLAWLSSIAKGFPAFLKFALVTGSLAGAYGAAVAVGWL